MRKKVFCLPYAGGSAKLIYGKWQRLEDPNIEIIPVEFPGRGSLLMDKCYETIDEAIDGTLRIIRDSIKNCEYGIWGHSMGAIIAYELGNRINELELKKPKNIIVTGKKPLHLKDDEEPIHELPDDEFIKEVIELNGTQKGVFENEELKKLFLPVLRNDFKLVHEYKYKKPLNEFDIPLTVITGNKDNIRDVELFRWNDLTSSKCKIIILEGDHFFINDNVENMWEIIKNTI
ncbi:thioesterase II family protein [Wukongibacter sp. M2B1]|uniref:thioesterase II family protein n=1 Tax=Wukongibacter sp. M2B1 TaxID=3088895 RepID=UPI003D7C02E6